MIETLYTKTRRALNNSAKIQDEKNLLEEANRKLTDEIKTINIQKIELENKVQNAKRALLLPEHGKPLNGSVQLELCIIFYLVQAHSLTMLVSSNLLQPPLWTCQPQPGPWTWM